jgi:hypothetical protein
MNKPARRRSSYKTIEDQQTQPQQSSDATPSFSAANSRSSSSSKNKDNGDAMDGAHRKIELQSPEDLTFLINNVRRAAEEHINAAFPPVDDAQHDGADELRVRIEKLVADVCVFFFFLLFLLLSVFRLFFFLLRFPPSSLLRDLPPLPPPPNLGYS